MILHYIKNKKNITLCSLLTNKRIIISMIIILCLSIIVIWSFHKRHNRDLMQASKSWQEINKSVITPVNSIELHSIKNFIKNNNNNYGVFMSLTLANYFINKGNFIEAEQELYQALKQTQEINLKSLINIRLARIQLQQHDITKTLETLDQIRGKGWINWAESIRGDVEILRGNYNFARFAYERALKNNESQILYTIVQMKLNNLYIIK